MIEVICEEEPGLNGDVDDYDFEVTTLLSEVARTLSQATINDEYPSD